MIQTQTPLFQQDLEQYDPSSSLKLCAPTALYELALRKGYDMPSPEDFVRSLDWERGWDEDANGWRRSELCKQFRTEYGVQSVTWWSRYSGISQSQSQIARMRANGYIETDQEQAYLESVGFKLRVADVALRDSVVVTVNSGFSCNTSPHAVVIDSFDSTTDHYQVFDPDARNHQIDYPRSQLEKFISSNGAITAILGRNDTEMPS